MAVNRGKQFEDIIQESFERVPNTVVARLHDQTTGFYGSKNPCDFFIFHKPIFYPIECKSVHGNTLSISSNPKPDKTGKLRGFYGNISDYQWEKLSEMSKVPGVVAGVICWWVDKDTTMFIDIRLLQELKNRGYKSIDYCASFALEDIDNLGSMWTWVTGKKKRVFFDYDMESFFNSIGELYE